MLQKYRHEPSMRRALILIIALFTYKAHGEDQHIADAFTRYLAAQNLIVESPLEDYLLDSWFNSLTASSSKPSSRPLLLLDNSELNAFASYDGLIALHSGSFTALDSLLSLQGVVAHEIAHQDLLHLSRGQELSQRNQFVLLLAYLGAAILSVENPEIAEALRYGSNVWSIDRELSFSRALEQEADLYASELLTKAGLNPYALYSAMASMAKQSSLLPSYNPYLSSHPISEQRLSYLFELGASEQKQTDLAYQWLRASYGASSSIDVYNKIQLAISDNDYERVNRLFKEALEAQHQPFFLYAAQLEWLLRSAQLKQARSLHTRLNSVFPNNRLLDSLIFAHDRQHPSIVDIACRLAEQRESHYSQQNTWAARSLCYRAQGDPLMSEFSSISQAYWSGNSENAIQRLTQLLNQIPQSQHRNLRATLAHWQSDFERFGI
jgi:predicted Zn-dependent protease